MQEWWQQIINIAVLGGVGGIGWLARTLFERVSKVEDALTLHKIEVAKDYVSYARFSETMAQVHGILGRIEGKIDGKVDRS